MTLRACTALVVACSAAVGLDARTLQGEAAPSAPRVSVIAGRVLDGTTGQPVPAAVVTLAASGQRPQPTTPRVLTDTSGRFVFFGVTKGAYALDATKPGWLDGSFGRLRPSGTAVPLENRGPTSISDCGAPV
jgi:protocatechuate 3,4-dioxygenase beta subunit